MRPVDRSINHTLEFVLGNIPSTKCRILEVGSGNGELALKLHNLGHRIIALDSSEDEVRQAQGLGIDARRVNWPDFEDSAFDVIMFTRSLHHIHLLAEAVAKTNALLNRDGIVVVEDFAFDEASPALIEWFYGVLSLLDSCGELLSQEDCFARRFLVNGGGVDAWRRDHDHDLNSAPKMSDGLKAVFGSITETSVPYVYRYLCPLLEDSEHGYSIASKVFEMETRLAGTGAINLIGRRFVGRKI